MKISIPFLQVILACLGLAFVAPDATAQTSDPLRDTMKDAVGVYSGPFGPNTITIRLESVEGKTASGYSVVGKNRRPFRGSVSVREGIPHFNVREPGDNPDDGIFRFQYSPEQQALVGTWTPNNKKLAEIRFSLAKSGKTVRGAETKSPRGEKGETSAGAQQWTEGTIVGNVGPDTKHSYVVVKDAAGKEHQFIVLKGYLALTPFLAGPEYYVGQRKRVHWDFETHPETGEQVKVAHEITDVASDVYLPAKGSAERAAIIEAVRADYQRRYKKQVTIEPEVVRVESGWAGVSGTAKEKGEKGPGAIWVAVLRGSGTRWKVVGTSAGDENSATRGKDDDRPQRAEWKRLDREYPEAPESIVGLLDYP